VRVAGGCVDLVPPAQTNESAAGNVLQVVKVGREEQEGQDEDEDAGVELLVGTGAVGQGGRCVQVVNEENTKEIHQQGSWIQKLVLH
jgi:hypothetical protein